MKKVVTGILRTRDSYFSPFLYSLSLNTLYQRLPKHRLVFKLLYLPTSLGTNTHVGLHSWSPTFQLLYLVDTYIHHLCTESLCELKNSTIRTWGISDWVNMGVSCLGQDQEHGPSLSLQECFSYKKCSHRTFKPHSNSPLFLLFSLDGLLVERPVCLDIRQWFHISEWSHQLMWVVI